MISHRRHAVMVSSGAHAAIEEMRQRHRATHARVVDALLASSTREGFETAMEQLQAQRRLDRKAREQRRRDIEKLLGTMGDAAYGRLLEVLGRADGVGPQAGAGEM